MTYLISIAIGPVQDFIASARRSRDLWFGSWLLSELSKAVAHEIVIQTGTKDSLIFPAPDSVYELLAEEFYRERDFSVANKIVALVDHPEEIAQRANDALQARLGQLVSDTLTLKDLPDGRDFLRNRVAIPQIKDLPEFYWAAYPLDDAADAAQYRKARAMTEALLASRKAARDFWCVTWGSEGPKSSLDGQRESALTKVAYKQANGENRSPLELRRKYGLHSRHEQLCGVGLLKRLGQRSNRGQRKNEDSFFSTSHVAALPFIQQIQHENIVTEYINTLTSAAVGLTDAELGKVPSHSDAKLSHAFVRQISGNKVSYDGHLLFEERLKDFFDNKDADEQKLELAKKALRKFLKGFSSSGKDSRAYYAVLLADGDRMGATIGNQPSIAAHQELSRCLSRFAGEVRRLVEVDYQGWVVYAGGDDVLAFVPLHQLIECARALADKFANSFVTSTKTDGSKFTDKDGNPPTLSIGVGISHHLDPLSDALDLARRAEKTAKGVSGKNALAVIVSKRGGSETPVKGRWGEVDERLQRFTWLHRADAIPDGAAYDLRTMARELKHIPKAIPLEAKRILRRKRARQGTEDLPDKLISELLGYLGKNDYTAEDLAKELIVARLLAQATDQAGIKLENLPGTKEFQQEAPTKQ